ncbi:hypothetical protein BWGOE3_25050 [Bacillus mycoides]|nr:hypothetical protein BWGOE3_25050 [Bacillus mycoides]
MMKKGTLITLHYFSILFTSFFIPKIMYYVTEDAVKHPA